MKNLAGAQGVGDAMSALQAHIRQDDEQAERLKSLVIASALPLRRYDSMHQTKRAYTDKRKVFRFKQVPT